MRNAMDWKVNLLPNAGLLISIWQSHQQQGSVGIRRVVPLRRITRTLGIPERFPRERQGHFRSAIEFRIALDYLCNVPCVPKTVFEAGVPQEVRPKPVVYGVADGLKKSTENRSRDNVACGLSGIDFD